jgi:AcrR family transcriptional regulator
MVGMARPKEQTARRRELVEAAGRAIVRRGLTGLRIKDVAQEAGLSAGSVSYYYRDFDDLVADVHQDAVDRFYWSRRRAVEAGEDPESQLLALVEQGVPDGGDPTSTVLYELHLHAARSRTHAVLMTALFDREVSLYSGVLETGRRQGVFTLDRATVDVVAVNAVALEDAFGLHLVGRNTHVDAPMARAHLLAFLRTATGAPLSHHPPGS